MSHCLLSFSGETMLALKHVERWGGWDSGGRALGWGRPGHHLGGIRLHRPQGAGDKCPSHMPCALWGLTPSLEWKFGDAEARPLPHSPVEEAAT